MGDREYVDRWGRAYQVIWNDQPGDPSLVSTCFYARQRPLPDAD